MTELQNNGLPLPAWQVKKMREDEAQATRVSQWQAAATLIASHLPGGPWQVIRNNFETPRASGTIRAPSGLEIWIDGDICYHSKGRGIASARAPSCPVTGRTRSARDFLPRGDAPALRASFDWERALTNDGARAVAGEIRRKVLDPWAPVFATIAASDARNVADVSRAAAIADAIARELGADPERHRSEVRAGREATIYGYRTKARVWPGDSVEFTASVPQKHAEALAKVLAEMTRRDPESEG